jgi:hypothetical protein
VSLRCGAELDLLHHRSCDRWLWCRWHIARHIEHRGQFCSEEKGATVLWLCSWNPRRKCVFGTYLWRHFRRSCELALVFLDVGNLADHTRVFVDKLRSNLPLGAIALVVIPWLVRNRHAENSARAPTFFTRLRRVDWLGTSFFLSSFVCLFLALQWGGQTMPWKFHSTSRRVRSNAKVHGGRVLDTNSIFETANGAFGYNLSRLSWLANGYSRLSRRIVSLYRPT